jgi:FtsP/CotA-like multicopper oxidase with cupredoxin domain
MTQQHSPRRLTRRDFLKLGAGALAAAAGARFIPTALNKPPAARAGAQGQAKIVRLAASDGWIKLPGQVLIPGSDPLNPKYFSPDPWAPPGRTTYMFGFRDVTGWTEADIVAQKGLTQHTAPILWVDQGDELYLTLTNLGFVLRPDLIDAHTVHWHGFRNAIPYFDGVPQTGVSVPLGRDFVYYYNARDPGTYMYHCHVEEVEHIQMGMGGPIFIRPAQNGNTALYPSGKFAYNDGDGSTGYDREFALMLSEVWAEMHWNNAHIQLSEWTDYHADFYMINGRAYPDTLLPNLPDPGLVDTGAPLQYQPMSALVTAKPGERVLLRFINFGYETQTMAVDEIKMTVVGKDAGHLRGRDSTNLYYDVNALRVAPGATFDVIFTAPAFSGGSGTSGLGYDAYSLYNRNYDNLTNGNGTGPGGQRTEIRIYPALPDQLTPNT